MRPAAPAALLSLFLLCFKNPELFHKFKIGEFERETDFQKNRRNLYLGIRDLFLICFPSQSLPLAQIRGVCSGGPTLWDRSAIFEKTEP